ncbi:hypothetical protein [Sulfitobacter sp. JL08]|uniref:hypothetical protein n=1 Tax=Sulfitobacter sp. JL08 TaxID=2070369 RepID=UPI0013B3B52C|nr:hypothetical protein [Sulfitobacter sp. JL08]
MTIFTQILDLFTACYGVFPCSQISRKTIRISGKEIERTGKGGRRAGKSGKPASPRIFDSAVDQVSLTKGWIKIEAAIGANRGDCLVRAHSVNSIFSLRPLAAQIMPQVQNQLCCHAVGKPAIHARRGKTSSANWQTA